MNSRGKNYNKSYNPKEKVADTHRYTQDVDEVEYASENSSIPENLVLHFQLLLLIRQVPQGIKHYLSVAWTNQIVFGGNISTFSMTKKTIFVKHETLHEET